MSRNLSTRSKAEPISEAEKSYARTTTRIQVAAAIWILWDRLRKERDLDQKWLADRMGKSTSRTSRLLKGPGNWTLDTVSDLLEAMGGRLTLVEAHTYAEIAKGKADKRSGQVSSRRILQIKTEVLFVDDPEWPGMAEVNPLPVSSTGAWHLFHSPIVRQVEAA